MCACTVGLPSLRDEDVGLLESRCRVGSIKHESNIWSRVSSGFPRLSSFLAVTPMCVNGAEWGIYDFGGAIPLLLNDQIFENYGKSLAGGNKCHIIHLDASLLPIKIWPSF